MEKQNVLRDKNGWIMANPFTRYIKRNAGILIAFILFCAVLSIATDSFLTLDNIFSVLRQVSINAILAFGMTFVLIVGGIDLSMGSVVAATGCLSVILITQGMSLVLSILIALCLGAAIGLINGFVISRTSIPPFIVTLAMMTAVRGIAYIMTNARSVVCTDEAFTSIGNGYLGPIPLPVVLVAALLIITSVFLSRTRFGRRMYAIGGNRDAAIYSGINVKRITMLVYVIAGVLSAVAGVLLASRIYSGQPTAGEGYECDAIAAAILGGTSFNGGFGTVGGTLIGALVIGILNNGLNLMEVQFYWQYVVKGAVILLAVYIDTFKYTKRLKK